MFELKRGGAQCIENEHPFTVEMLAFVEHMADPPVRMMARKKERSRDTEAEKIRRLVKMAGFGRNQSNKTREVKQVTGNLT